MEITQGRTEKTSYHLFRENECIPVSVSTAQRELIGPGFVQKIPISVISILFVISYVVLSAESGKIKGKNDKCFCKSLCYAGPGLFSNVWHLSFIYGEN